MNLDVNKKKTYTIYINSSPGNQNVLSDFREVWEIDVKVQKLSNIQILSCKV